tara:strand:+ start:635 stop:1285 length:651 start_codon:yes stop_codon:yes gene_type:complete
MISNNLKKRTFTSILLLSLVFLIFNFNPVLIYSLIILGVLSILEFLQLTKKMIKGLFFYIMLNLIFIIFILSFCFTFYFFSNITGLKFILFIILMGCISSDIGGYFFGKILKGPKLTKISPNKTISGAVGSIISTTMVCSLLFFYFLGNLSIKFLVVACMTSIFCQIGDLLFSFLKRKSKMKDTGNFLPGHGGVLDRIDGILLGIPFGFITLIFLN